MNTIYVAFLLSVLYSPLPPQYPHLPCYEAARQLQKQADCFHLENYFADDAHLYMCHVCTCWWHVMVLQGSYDSYMRWEARTWLIYRLGPEGFLRGALPDPTPWATSP